MKVTRVDNSEVVYFDNKNFNIRYSNGNWDVLDHKLEKELEAAYQRFKARESVLEIKRKALINIFNKGFYTDDELARTVLDKLDAIDRGEG